MKIIIPTESFSLTSKIIHIVSAVAFIAALILMFGTPTTDTPQFKLHQSLGGLVLILYVIRIVWMAWAGKPQAIGTRFEKFIAHMAHLALYGILIFMPLTGLLTSLAKGKEIVLFNVLTLPGFSERNPGLSIYVCEPFGLLRMNGLVP